MSGGRPPKWDDPIAFDKAVDQYFATEGIQHTWTGLTIHLGFCSRDSLHEYGQKPEFSDSIKKALLRIENKYEVGLLERNPTGSIFALKNFGWKDKQEVDQRTTIKDDRLDLTKLSEDELRILAEMQRKSGAGTP